jgi:hypothetical protein
VGGEHAAADEIGVLIFPRVTRDVELADEAREAEEDRRDDDAVNDSDDERLALDHQRELAAENLSARAVENDVARGRRAARRIDDRRCGRDRLFEREIIGSCGDGGAPFARVTRQFTRGSAGRVRNAVDTEGQLWDLH